MQHESNKSDRGDGEDQERNGEVIMLDSVSLREKPNSTSDADPSASILPSQEKSLSTIFEIAHTLTGLCRLETKLAQCADEIRPGNARGTRHRGEGWRCHPCLAYFIVFGFARLPTR